MKKTSASFIILLFIMCNMVYAEDFNIKINGKPISDPIVLDEGVIDFEMTIEEGVLLQRIDIESSSGVIEALLEEELNKAVGVRALATERVKEQVPLPETVPSGIFDIKITAIFEDANFQQQEISHTTTLDIPSTGFASDSLGALAGMMPKDATLEIMNFFSKKEIPRLTKDLTQDDLIGASIDDIGLTREDILNGNYELNELKSGSEVIRITADDISKLIAAEDNPAVKKALESIALKDGVDVEKSFRSFQITNPKNGMSTYQTKIVLSINDDGGIVELELVEVIPKTISGSSDDIIFSEQPIVLEKDPIVKWTFNNVPPDQTKDYSYTVNKKLDSVETQTIAGIEKPGAVAKFVRFNLNGGWIVTGIVLVALLVLVIFGLVKVLKKKK